MRALAHISTAAIVMVLAQTSIAEELEELIDATDPERLVSVIQDLGYRAKLSVDDAGDPLILSSVGGTEFSLQFFGCSENKHDQCKLLMFRVGYDLEEGTNLETINSWNEMILVGRGYLDDESDPWFEWAVNMYGGVTRQNFTDSFDWWESSVRDFEEHIDY